MKIQVETVSPVEKKVSVEVDADRVDRELDRAYSSLGRRVKLKGFRPGKAPRQVLERHFRDEVEREVVERLVGLAYGEMVSAHGVDAVAPPRVDVKEPGLRPAQPLRFAARVEVKPRLHPKDYKGLQVTRKPAAVSDAQVDEELARLADAFAELVPVEGREQVRDGDYAVVDHQGTADGQPFEGGAAQGVTVRVAPGDFFAGFFPQLAGAAVGGTVAVEQTFPADFRVAVLRGRTARFTVTVKALRERRVPALDDAFVKSMKVPGAETLEQLRADLRRRMEERERQRAQSELNDALVKAALTANDFEVPPALVERTIDSLLEGATRRFARQGIDMSQLGMDLARLRADLREQALLQVRGALLLEAVAEAEKIEPSPEDVEREIERIAAEAHAPVEKVRPQMRSAEAAATLRNKVREDQVLAFLASHAKIADG